MDRFVFWDLDNREYILGYEPGNTDKSSFGAAVWQRNGKRKLPTLRLPLF